MENAFTRKLDNGSPLSAANLASLVAISGILEIVERHQHLIREGDALIPRFC